MHSRCRHGVGYWFSSSCRCSWCSGIRLGTSRDCSGHTLDRYIEVFTPTFFDTFAATLWIAIAGTALCFVIGAPMAYWMALKAPESQKGVLLALVLVPFWANFLVRTIGWLIILSPEGWLSLILQSIGFDPISILYTRPAVLLGVVYNYLPMMILPMFVAFERVGTDVREAAKDLGATPVATFMRVTFPIALPGIIVGVALVYIPLMGDYITAIVLGGTKGNMVGQMLASQFQTAQNWALGSAMAIMLILMTIVSLGLLGLLFWVLYQPFKRARDIRLAEVTS